MTRKCPWSFLAAGALSLSTVAQTVRVVDRLGGGDFLEPNAAVAASSPGDTILIRNGGSFLQVDVPISLRFLAEGARPTIASLVFSLPSRPSLPILVADLNVFWLRVTNAEHVVIENVRGGSLVVADATTAIVNTCRFRDDARLPGLTLTRTAGTVIDTELGGAAGRCVTSGGGTQVIAATAGLELEDATVLLVGASVTGGRGAPIGCSAAPAGAGISGVRSQVRLAATTIQAGITGTVAVALDAPSLVEADPAVTFVGSTQPVPQPRLSTWVRAQGVAVGAAAQVVAFAPPQSALFLAVADTVAAPQTTPFGPLWVDPFGYFVTVVSGVTDGNGQLMFGYSMPGLPKATPLWFQALVLPPLDPPQLSMPSAALSR
ncbi:MAG: hypothetical protein IPK26_28420 [Planctomycetes bacterium]|nr:hypothetical protein [Planctomycetota bacterium]